MYGFKKETSLDKHMITKHQELPCKECQEKFTAFMELLKYVAKYHFKKQGEVQGEDEVTVKTGDPEEDKTNKTESDFVFCELILDEFLS